MGHDLLQEIRSTAGLQNYYIRKQKSRTRGQAEMKNVARSQKRISTDKSKLNQKYNNNWKRIQYLLSHCSLTSEERAFKLKGLKVLSSEDDAFFYTNADSSTNKESKLSWIWEVAMLDQPKRTTHSMAQDMINDWESEGML